MFFLIFFQEIQKLCRGKTASFTWLVWNVEFVQSLFLENLLLCAQKEKMYIFMIQRVTGKNSQMTKTFKFVMALMYKEGKIKFKWKKIEKK